LEVALAVVALNASSDANHRMNITGVFTDIHPPVMPCRMTNFCLVIFFEANAAEVGQPRTIEVHLLDADGNRTLSFGKTIVVPPPPRAGSRPSFSEVFFLRNALFTRTGDHEFSILVGDDHKRSVQIYVNEPPTKGDVDDESASRRARI
jgi:hypothetical protein